jgi:hypothetical protein
MANSARSDSMHPLDLMPAWAWLLAAVVLLGTVSLMSLAALDAYQNACTTTHALCWKNAN